MYRFRSTKYLTVSAMLIALIVVIGVVCYAIRITDRGLFQISDGLMLALAALIPGPMFLLVSPIAGMIIDLIFGSFVYLPATLVIHLLMVVILKACNRGYWSYIGIFLGACCTMLYPVYNFFLVWVSTNSLSMAQSTTFLETVNDAIQTAVTIVMGLVLFTILFKINIKVNYRLWNDNQFDIYKTRRDN